MISPLSHAAARAAAAGGGLPWYAWVLIIILVVVLLSFLFEKLEGRPKDVSVTKDSPRDGKSNVTPRAFGSQTVTVGSMRPAGGPGPPPTLSQSNHGPPTTYGTLATQKPHAQTMGAMPRQNSFEAPRRGSNATVGSAAYHPGVPVAPTHSMPVTRHSVTAGHVSSVTSSPQLGPASPPVKSLSTIPQTTLPRQRSMSPSGRLSPVQPVHPMVSLPARGISPPRINSPTAASIGSIGSPVHAHSMQPSFSHHHLQTYPNYGHGVQGPTASPPGTWPHNPAGMPPRSQSSSYHSDMQKHH